jgi:DNA polymerase III subunit beta
VVFSTNGKPEVALKSGSFKGTVKGMEASEFPSIPVHDVSQGILLDIRQ